jgi:hypothetical protein
MSVLPTDEMSDTDVTVAPLLPPPHPLRSKQGARNANVKQLEIFHNFISLASQSSRAAQILRRRGPDFLRRDDCNFRAATGG